MGTTGISIEKGFSSSNIYEVEVKKAMVSTARKIIIVADHSKFGEHGLKSFCDWEEIDYLITSTLVDKTILKNFKGKYKNKLILVQM